MNPGSGVISATDDGEHRQRHRQFAQRLQREIRSSSSAGRRRSRCGNGFLMASCYPWHPSVHEFENVGQNFGHRAIADAAESPGPTSTDL